MMKNHIKDKKQAIMDSALELFTTKGFDNTSTASISKNAGVATGTLFTYFDSKLDLINQLYLATKREFFEALSSLMNIKIINEETAMEVWKASVLWGVSNPTKMKFIIQYSSSPYISKLTWEGIDEEMETMGQIFVNSVKEGTIKDLPVDYLSYVTTSHIYATVSYMITNGINDEIFVEKMFPTMWDMLKK
jgi:AcrR family transcriptional regulator